MTSALATLVHAAKSAGLDTRRVYQALSAASLERAAAEQDLVPLRSRLREIVPDVGDQYSEGFDAVEFARYWEPKMRGLHAFQIDAVLRTVATIESARIAIADIGDSSGNHAAYLHRLIPAERLARVVSVNLDPVAVAKIRAKGGEAVLARAEELDLGPERFDLFMSFETLEHLTDPLRFLRRLAVSGATDRLVLSVPYVRRSRVGLQFLRHGDPLPDRVTAERVHIFELSPEDWMLLCRFGGWATVFKRTYRQYPMRSILRCMAPVWRRLDFEGFLCLSLRRDLAVSDRYADW